MKGKKRRTQTLTSALIGTHSPSRYCWNLQLNIGARYFRTLSDLQTERSLVILFSRVVFCLLLFNSFISVLGIEDSGSHMLSKHSSSELHPQLYQN